MTVPVMSTQISFSSADSLPRSRPGYSFRHGMFKKPVQRGRSGARGRVVPLRYVEPRSDARTKLDGLFEQPVRQAAESPTATIFQCRTA